ncbi:restriction endonuclease subunit S [Lacinutrix venerupis]|uniref:restriction endonuclease subunit S n=1 Tax=Lacinutrix venerupis TaxID=1486034 RepID=UPI001473E51B|nr:restriction endonuclease subunit S [Lacinutrix venerupis]
MPRNRHCERSEAISSKQRKSLIPKLRFKEFEGEWKEIKIGEVLKIGSGKDYKHLEEGKIPVYGTGGLMTYVDKYLHEGESVCIGRKGTIDKPVYLNEKFWTVDTLFYTHSFKKSLPKFVFGIFERINWKLYNEASGVPSLSKSTIEKIKVSIPNLPEQQKIANFLTAVDTKLQQLTTKKETLALYKKGVMQQLFSQQLRFKPDVTNETVIASTQDEAISPNKTQFPDWEEKKLGEVGNIVSGLTYSPNDIVDEENGVLVLRSSNVQDGKLSFQDNVYVKVESFNPVEKNDVLICVRNGSKRLIGKNAIISDDSVGIAFGAFMSIYRSKFNTFLFHYFSSEEYKKEVHKNLGATINSINGSDLKKFKVPFPSEKEQQKIANYLSAIDKKIEAVQTQLTQTQAFKKGLLQQLFV